MRLSWKTLCWTAALTTLGLTSGCGGINGSYSVSPASFFLPGLVLPAAALGDNPAPAASSAHSEVAEPPATS